MGEGSGFASSRKKEPDQIVKEESKDKPVVVGRSFSQKNLMGSQYKLPPQPLNQPEVKPN